MDWIPTLADRDGPIYRCIVEALTADIASGRLRRVSNCPLTARRRRRFASALPFYRMERQMSVERKVYVLDDDEAVLR